MAGILFKASRGSAGNSPVKPGSESASLSSMPREQEHTAENLTELHLLMALHIAEFNAASAPAPSMMSAREKAEASDEEEFKDRVVKTYARLNKEAEIAKAAVEAGRATAEAAEAAEQAAKIAAEAKVTAEAAAQAAKKLSAPANIYDWLSGARAPAEEIKAAQEAAEAAKAEAEAAEAIAQTAAEKAAQAFIREHTPDISSCADAKPLAKSTSSGNTWVAANFLITTLSNIAANIYNWFFGANNKSAPAQTAEETEKVAAAAARPVTATTWWSRTFTQSAANPEVEPFTGDVAYYQ